jgi:hypothetical protein
MWRQVELLATGVAGEQPGYPIFSNTEENWGVLNRLNSTPVWVIPSGSTILLSLAGQSLLQ